jgi:hypothetical protein
MNCAPNVFTIFQGDSKAMNLKAVYADTLTPLDLTACTAIVVTLPSADGTTPITLTLAASQVSITSPTVLGAFVVSAAAIGTISSLLNVGELQTFYVAFTISGAVTTVAYQNALTVLEST